MAHVKDRSDERPKPLLTSGVQRRLGARLRAGYAEFAREGLPSEHVDLLLRLRQKERDLRARPRV